MKIRISTLAKDKNELHYLIHALYAMGIQCPGYTANKFIDQEYLNVILLPNGTLAGNYALRRECADELVSVGNFLAEAAKRKFSSSPTWKIGCRTVEVRNKSLYIPADDITIPKSTVEEMLEALE